jgi:hypothetical protein
MFCCWSSSRQDSTQTKLASGTKRAPTPVTQLPRKRSHSYGRNARFSEALIRVRFRSSCTPGEPRKRLCLPRSSTRKLVSDFYGNKQKPIPSEFAICDKNSRTPKPRRSVTSHNVYARSKEPGLRENTRTPSSTGNAVTVMNGGTFGFIQIGTERLPSSTSSNSFDK